MIKRINPAKKNDPPKTFATPVWDGVIEIEELADQIAGRSSLTKGDILNVLQNFLDEIPHYLLMGKAVNLNKLGIQKENPKGLFYFLKLKQLNNDVEITVDGLGRIIQ